MKCQKCGAKWTTKLSKDKEICPFCGEILAGDSPYKQAVDVLGMIIARFGIEIYSDERRLFGLVNDLLPNMSKEKNILKNAISLGVSQLIISIKTDSYDRKDLLKKGYELLDNGGLSSYWCAASLYILAAPLNIDTIDIYPLDERESVTNCDNQNILFGYNSIIEEEYCEKTLEELNILVEKGDAVAATELGERYYSGIGVEENIDVAIVYFTRAADAGYPVAEFILGYLYDEGQHISHDVARALEYYQKSANGGYPEAEYKLGEMYYLGQGCEKNDSEALYWILKAAEELEDPDIYIALAIIYKDSEDESVRDEKRAFECVNKAVEFGEADAYNLLGTFYEMGCGVEQSYDKAAQYYKMAAEHGVEMSYLNLGGLYQMGFGVPKDDRKAAEYFQYGANTGNMYCLNALGMRYKDGIGVPRDYQKAFDLFLNAAYAGNFAGEVNVGLAYANGQGVEEDKSEAKRWFTLAAEHGRSDAMVALGLYKEKGIPNGEPDLQAAFEWYLRAAEVGDHPNAEWLVGNCYAQGLMGVEIDRCTAFQWYAKAAELGQATAQNNIACDYIKGEIVDLDYQLAIKWFEEAIQQDDMYALNNYGTLMLNGRGISRDVNRALKLIKRSAELGYPDAQFNLGICYFEGWGTVRNLDESLGWLVKANNAGVPGALEYLRKGFKEKNGTWIKRGRFGHIPTQKQLPPSTEPIECKGGCTNYCTYANLSKVQEVYVSEEFCYCKLLKEKVFRKTKCPFYKDGVGDLLKLFVNEK